MLVPYEPKDENCEAVKKEALENGVTEKWMHEAAPLCVTAYANDDFCRYAEQLYFAGKRNEGRQPSDYWMLRKEDDYHLDTGMQLEKSDYTW